MSKTKSPRLRRQIRIRAKISGTASRPRLSIYRSNTNIYAQLIDDTTGKTLGAASDLKLEKVGTKVEMSKKVGEAIAKIDNIRELNIGQSIIARSVFSGFEKALIEMIALIK